MPPLHALIQSSPFTLNFIKQKSKLIKKLTLARVVDLACKCGQSNCMQMWILTAGTLRLHVTGL
jgi:hypothetical protein